MGTALSPNGLGMAGEGMVSLSQLDRILEIDTEKRTITVEAGARVSQVRAWDIGPSSVWMFVHGRTAHFPFPL